MRLILSKDKISLIEFFIRIIFRSFFLSQSEIVELIKILSLNIVKVRFFMKKKLRSK